MRPCSVSTCGPIQHDLLERKTRSWNPEAPGSGSDSTACSISVQLTRLSVQISLPKPYSCFDLLHLHGSSCAVDEMMNFHFGFQFGLGKYFNFTFAIGNPLLDSGPRKLKPESGSLVEDSKPVTSFSKVSKATKSSSCKDTPLKESSQIVPEVVELISCDEIPLDGPLNRTCVESSIFFTLPAEIRSIIYLQLLLSPVRIKDAGQYIGCTQTPILKDRRRIKHVDARMMRTCHRIYSETMPILYGRNVFSFESTDSIMQFRAHGLEQRGSLGMYAESELILLKG